MASRKIPLATGEYYHIFNRTQNKEPFFTRRDIAVRAMKTLDYYRYASAAIRLSYFLSYGVEKREKLLASMEKGDKLVEFTTFCLMPNHFHLLIKQLEDNGITRFLSLFENSLTKYVNTKYKREGHLFKGTFKAVRIEDDDQFLHVHRYIHLNPHSSFVVKSIKDLVNYPFSSLRQYLGLERGFCNTEDIISEFSSIKKYFEFISNQADYQRKLKEIVHLTQE